MYKVLTDIHTHSNYSFDSETPLAEMLDTAYQKGIVYYGVAEHFDYDLCFSLQNKEFSQIDAEEYFHGARHLQEDYEGAMHVLVGCEFGYSEDARITALYQQAVEKYRPDFIVNSVHTLDGADYYFQQLFYTKDEKGNRVLRERLEVFREYLRQIRRSLDVPYPYDIVGHIGYAARYAPYEEKGMPLVQLTAELDDVLSTIIKKGKILEVNSSSKELCVPCLEIVKRYFELGGRAISFASDAHAPNRIADKREEIVAELKKIGFTHVTVPFKGEYVKVEI